MSICTACNTTCDCPLPAPADQMRRMDVETHPYNRACRNTQHSGCTCMHPVDDRWCGKPRYDPVHVTDQPAPAEAPDAAAERVRSGLRLGTEQERRLRLWPKDRIRPKSVALGVISLLAEVDALRAELNRLTARAEQAERGEAALRGLLEQAAVFWRPVVADVEHGILSAKSIRLMAEDFMVGLRLLLAAPDRADREGI